MTRVMISSNLKSLRISWNSKDSREGSDKIMGSAQSAFAPAPCGAQGDTDYECVEIKTTTDCHWLSDFLELWVIVLYLGVLLIATDKTNFKILRFSWRSPDASLYWFFWWYVVELSYDMYFEDSLWWIQVSYLWTVGIKSIVITI